MRITKVQVHQATKISEVTISKCYKKLNLYKDKLFPKGAIEKYNITFDKAETKQYVKKKKLLPINNTEQKFEL
jgi:hypothetical protein